MPGKINFCVKILGPVGLLPIFVPSQYILIAFPLSIILLAPERFSGYYLISSHYVSHVLPFIYISGIYGAANLLKLLQNKFAFTQIKSKKFVI